MKSLFCMFCTLAIASSVSAQETGNAMLKYGLNFLKTPYVAHTLEVNEEEKLVVNFDEVDCTTFCGVRTCPVTLPRQERSDR